jgi:hypothetical protein
MTAIAIWCNHETPSNPGLWIAADSRVSNSGSSVLIDDASKIFSLPVICRAQGKDGFFSEVYEAHTYGYCFAGSTLLGQNTYLTLQPLLGNLVSPVGYIPSIADVAKYLLAYLRLTFDDVRERIGPASMVEVGLFGHCRKTGQLSMFHYIPKLDGSVYRMTCESHENMQDKNFVYLGDQRPHMCAKITAAFAGEIIPGRPLSRIPRHIIQDHIDDPNSPSIGGDLQLGVANRFGFCPFVLGKPRIMGQPAAYLSYLGRELTPDIQYVGDALVGCPGMF